MEYRTLRIIMTVRVHPVGDSSSIEWMEVVIQTVAAITAAEAELHIMAMRRANPTLCLTMQWG